MRGGVDRHFQEGFLEDMPYDVPNYLADCAMRTTHVPVGFWRCVNHSQNCFFKESFVDEMAHAAGQDPYRYRRKMLRHHPRAGKLIAVLDAAASQARWDEPLPEDMHRGIALHEVHGTYTAAVIEISIADESRASCRERHRLRHDREPAAVEMQIERRRYALTAALYGEITIRDGRVEQSNFHDYRMLKIGPDAEGRGHRTRGESWGGVGEPAVSVVAPASVTPSSPPPQTHPLAAAEEP